MKVNNTSLWSSSASVPLPCSDTDTQNKLLHSNMLNVLGIWLNWNIWQLGFHNKSNIKFICLQRANKVFVVIVLVCNFLINLFILLYNIVLVFPYINMNPPQVYTCSPFWTLLPPPSPYHPSGSSQCTSPKHPVSCIEPGLASRFIHDILHVSMPFYQIIQPSLSLPESKRLFYTSVSLLLSRIQGYCYHLSKFHIYALLLLLLSRFSRVRLCATP